MRESFNGPHSQDAVQGRWRVGNWVIRQSGLSFGPRYAGSGELSDQDVKDQLRIMNKINVACLLSTPDPMTDQGLIELPTGLKKSLIGI